MPTIQSAKNVKWIEGLRGIASVLVLITHIARAFDYPLFFPADEASRAPRLLQLPILRIPAQGRVGVPIFAFLTGFVCALNPLRLARKEEAARARRRRQQRQALHEEEETPWAYASAVRTLAKSAFRRPPRLVLPAAVATLVSFCLTLAGGYQSANACDSFWVRYDAPAREATVGREARRFARALLTTWTDRDNPYDRHQWALLPLLVGAFQVYLVLLATMGCRFRYRVAVQVLLMAYWWLNQEPFTETFGSMITLGTLLADLSLHRSTQTWIATHHRLLSFLVAPLLLLLGLLVGSYPQEHEEWSPWSHWMRETFVAPPDHHGGGSGSLLVPKGTDPHRRFSALGVQLCALAVFLSPGLREALSHRVLLWLGQHSFAVYLTHGTILRTVGIWIAYGSPARLLLVAEGAESSGGGKGEGAEEQEAYLHVRSREAVFVAVVVFVVLSYGVAWAWMRWVDAECARATHWLETKVFPHGEGEDEQEVDGEREEDAEKAGACGSLSEWLLPVVQEEDQLDGGRQEYGVDEAGRYSFLKLGFHEHRRLGSRGLLG